MTPFSSPNSLRDRQNGVDDLCLMTGEITDENIAKQLEQRLVGGKIYTSVAEVLIAVNPFKMLPIYSEAHIKMYQNATMADASPHIFGLAERMYRRLVTQRRAQAVIISGESGAGKTETAKLILHYASSVSGSSPASQRMKQIILEANPLLESFGNAKTTRNNNSSRFGKYLDLTFNDAGEPCGGTTTNFLLEKTRVTIQQKSERNYHVFYQMLAGAWPQLLQACKVSGNPADFHYLSQSGTYDVPGVDDGRNFREVQRACTTIGISPQEQWYLFSSLCAILHLGNVRLVGKDAPAKLAQGSDGPLQLAAYLFGVPPEGLLGAINHKTVQMGGKRGSVVKVPQNADQATQIRDAISKEVYSRLFDYIITKLNYAMRGNGAAPGCSLGILDIYGFEIFDKNVFEQLCINFVNEKLQQIFLDAVVKGEQQLYVDEGLPWKQVAFFDNEAIVQLIEGSNPPGIMRILDDTCRALHAVDSDTADAKFFERLSGSGVASNKYIKMRPGTFTITHYAGMVNYSTDEICFKNVDNTFASVIDLLKTASSPFIRLLFPADEDRITQAPATSSTKIRQSAGQLTATLKRCETSYVRTIKSNDEKLPMTMDHARCKHQVQYVGLREHVKVKKAGYAYRAPYDQFLANFAILASRHQQGQLSSGKAGAMQLTTFISKKWPDVCPSSEWAFGKSLLFCSSPETFFALQELCEEARDPKGYAEKVRAFEEAQRLAEKQEAKIKAGKVKAGDASKIKGGAGAAAMERGGGDGKKGGCVVQ